MKDITLYKFGSVGEALDLSPFCVKVEAYLRLRGLAFEAVKMPPMRAPRGKLPYIELGGEVIADSSEIVRRLERHGAALDEGLTPTQRARARFIQSALEEHLYFALVYFRWFDEEGWRAFSPILSAYFKSMGVPGPAAAVARKMARRGTHKNLDGQGMGRMPREEIERIGRELLDALDATLGEGDFLLDDQPRAVDTSAFGMLEIILVGGPTSSPLTHHARSLPALTEYFTRLRERILSAG